MARRSCPCVNSRDAVTQRHALLRDAVTQRDVVTSFRFRTVTGLLEARRFDVEILDRRGGLHHDCYFVTRLFAISSSHGSLGSGHFATLLLFNSSPHTKRPNQATGAVLVRPDGFIAWRAKSSEAKPQDTLKSVLARVLCN